MKLIFPAIQLLNDPTPLPDRTLRSFSAFRNGFHHFAVEAGADFILGWDDFSFCSWLESETDIRSLGTHNSAGMVDLMCDDDRDSFETYGRLLRKFCSIHAIDLQINETQNVRSGSAMRNFLLADFLRDFRKQPSMFVGIACIRRLRSWVNGIISASRQCSSTLIDEQRFLELIDYIKDRQSVPRSCGWDKALLYSFLDQQGTVEMFFRMCDDFGFWTT